MEKRQTKGGLPAAANTANRKRLVLNNAMEYACEDIGANRGRTFALS